MIAELFLVVALAPRPAFVHADIIRGGIPIISRVVQLIRPLLAQNEEDQLKDALKKHPEIEDVFIHEDPKADRLKDGGWFEMPYTINGKGVWIKQKPKTDEKPSKRRIETSA